MMNSAVRQTYHEPGVRRATAADLPVCASIINDYLDAGASWLPRVIDRQAIEDMFGADLLDRRTIFVAEDGGEIAGYLSMDQDGRFIHAIYLRPQARCSGLGKALLDAAKSARPQGFELTVFELNSDALRFYKREALVEIPEGRNDDTPEGVATLLMRWPGGSR
ncbi:sortase-like acyltransferase [Hoeflea sp. IMCC20628]|uniref:GNAT family N-acetyltransferase n=1 Tax=Hoeflea sp. IMCC20628 TaxID=1620421 RepID=UPI00063BD8BB|nr:GNAT family N-acetyltransferase [Hoeflea sp. IMCC20628]AKH99296.1 sortase-like acyltransferase [Hoeflea sp. IMCC20628]